MQILILKLKVERTIADAEDEAKGDNRGCLPQQRMHPTLPSRPTQKNWQRSTLLMHISLSSGIGAASHVGAARQQKDERHEPIGGLLQTRKQSWVLASACFGGGIKHTRYMRVN